MVGVRLEPEVYQAVEEWRMDRPDPETNDVMSQAEALRWLIRFALEKGGELDKRSPMEAGYTEGLRRGRADFHRAMKDAWDRLNR
jgi:hypothetical protein